MCVILWKPQGEKLDAKHFENSIDAGNTHGWGLMRHVDDRVEVVRGMDCRDALDAYRKNEDAAQFIHFRFATHGEKNEMNCHPFKVTRGLYVMHNGISPVPILDKKRSDSWHVARLLQPMFERDKGFLESEYLSDILGFIGGTGSKYTFLRADGSWRIIGRKKGVESGNLWFSNDGPLVNFEERWYSRQLPSYSHVTAKQQADWWKHYDAEIAPKGNGFTASGYSNKSYKGSLCAANAPCETQKALPLSDTVLADSMEHDPVVSAAGWNRVTEDNFPTSLDDLARLSYDQIQEAVYEYPDEVAGLIWRKDLL